MNIIEEIKIEMLRQGLKQKDMAELCKISRVHTSRVLNGKDCKHSLVNRMLEVLKMEVKVETQSTCSLCHRPTEVTELEGNSIYGAYGFRNICNDCASKIDSQMDEQQGN